MYIKINELCILKYVMQYIKKVFTYNAFFFLNIMIDWEKVKYEYK